MSAAYAAFENAARAAARRFVGMPALELVDLALRLIEEAGGKIEDHMSLVDGLLRVAGQGSLDAVGLLVAFGADDDTVAAGLGAVAARSPDLVEAITQRGLQLAVADYLEGEVAAGRLGKRWCAERGTWLYGVKDKPA